MPFNPYNHEAYQGIGSHFVDSLPRSIQQIATSDTIRQMNNMVSIRRQAEEATRREYWMSQDRRLHRSERSALEGGLASDMINGQKDCTTNDNWQLDRFSW